MPRQVILGAAGLALLAGGCGHRTTGSLTLERGALMLASGSPRSAIPVFSQVIASVPDGPEPQALLAVACALDFESEKATHHAQEAQRRRSASEAPGWEGVALGLVAMIERRPAEAVEHFRKVKEVSPDGSALGTAAQQWLTLALILNAESDGALDLLKNSSRAERPAAERTTACLWTALIEAHARRGPEAAQALADAAGLLVSPAAAAAITPDQAAKGTDRDLLQAGLVALRQRALPMARAAFTALHERSPYAGDALVLLALVTAAQGEWEQARETLRKGCEKGPFGSRGLSHHLTSVVCALDGDPQRMIEHILVGQRLATRYRPRLPEPKEAQHDRVWLSDGIP